MIIHAGMMVIPLPIEDMGSVIELAQRFKLDFDDAYQCAVAKKYDLLIVSFDTDFDRTDRRRKTPAEIIKS
jgi:predicted nucleic acid-binding protein